MRKQISPAPPPQGGPLRYRLLLGALIGGLAVAVLVTVPRLQDDSGTAAPPSTPASVQSSSVTPTTLERTGVVSRLRDILGVRDRAYRERKPDLLGSVYTTDCPCLKGDQGAIKQLLNDGAVWVGASTSIRARTVEKVNERLWIVLAIFDGSPFRIETESGQLIRAVEGRSELFRFVLAKPNRDAELRLGFAAPVNEAD
jgi:hypothetical protein